MAGKKTVATVKAVSVFIRSRGSVTVVYYNTITQPRTSSVTVVYYNTITQPRTSSVTNYEHSASLKSVTTTNTMLHKGSMVHKFNTITLFY